MKTCVTHFQNPQEKRLNIRGMTFKSLKLNSIITDEPVDHIEKITDQLILASTYYYNKNDNKRYGRLYLIEINDTDLTEISRTDLWLCGILETRLLSIGSIEDDSFLCASMCSDHYIRIVKVTKSGSFKVVNKLKLSVDNEKINPNVIAVGLALYISRDDDNLIKIGGSTSDGKVFIYTMRHDDDEKNGGRKLTLVDKLHFIAHENIEIWAIEFFDNEDAQFSIATGADDCKVRYWDEFGNLIFENKRDHEAGVTVVRNTSDNATLVLTASYDGYIRVYERNNPIKAVHEWNIQKQLLSIGMELDEAPAAWRVELCEDIPSAVDLACCYGGIALRLNYETGKVLNLFPRIKEVTPTTSSVYPGTKYGKKELDVLQEGDKQQDTSTIVEAVPLIYGVCSLDGGKKVLDCSFYEQLIEFWEAYFE